MHQRVRSLLTFVSIVCVTVVVLRMLWGSARPTIHLRHPQDTVLGFLPMQVSNGMFDSIYKQQRDKLSRTLNDVKRQLAVLSCDMVELNRKLNKNASKVSVSGGWCKRESRGNSGEHAFDQPLAVALSHLFENQTVVSFGDGPGNYKTYLDSTQRLRKYDAYDGAPFTSETSNGVVEFLDLTAPQYGLPVYDWVMSLEVAEHIPQEYENIYVDNIVRHAKSGIVLSWAVPNQAGYGHVNNKAIDDVQRIMTRNGFKTDIKSSVELQKHARLPWLQRNVYVYRRKDGRAIDPTYA